MARDYRGDLARDTLAALSADSKKNPDR